MNARIIAVWSNVRPLRSRHGFSLLELVVVIGIIMALAGILTLTLPNLIINANEASLYTNLRLCDDMIQSWAATSSGKYPTGWDSLVTGSALYAYLPKNTDGEAVGGSITTLTLNATYLERLERAGITTVCDMTQYTGSSTNAVNASYMAANTTTPRTLASDGIIAQVDLANLPTDRVQMEFLSTHTYAIFGVGRGTLKTDANGNVTHFVGVGGYIKDQPIVVHPEGCTSPKVVYCVPCAVFDLGVTSTATTVSSRDSTVARYVGCVALGENGFVYSEEAINKFGQ